MFGNQGFDRGSTGNEIEVCFHQEVLYGSGLKAYRLYRASRAFFGYVGPKGFIGLGAYLNSSRKGL